MLKHVENTFYPDVPSSDIILYIKNPRFLVVFVTKMEYGLIPFICYLRNYWEEISFGIVRLGYSKGP